MPKFHTYTGLHDLVMISTTLKSMIWRMLLEFDSKIFIKSVLISQCFVLYSYLITKFGIYLCNLMYYLLVYLYIVFISFVSFGKARKIVISYRLSLFGFWNRISFINIYQCRQKEMKIRHVKNEICGITPPSRNHSANRIIIITHMRPDRSDKSTS